MIKLIDFMNGGVGRTARVALGVALIAWGLGYLGGTVGYAIAFVGLLPLALGAGGRCLLEAFTPKEASRHA